MKIWGIDLGGTKIECAVLQSREQPEVMVRKRLPTEADKGYAHILAQIKSLVDEVKTSTGEQPSKIGFATPGTLEPDTQLIKNSNTVCLNGKPLKSDLERLLGVPVTLANDANCFALAEAMMGAGKAYPDTEVIFGVIMGTGVGGGIVVHNKVINGLQGIAGEWGHNILEEGGADCYCGKHGCVEQVISGPALERYYKQVKGEERSLKAILEQYQNGNDPQAKETIERLLHYFGKAIASLINVLDPGLIIIGGGVGNIGLLYSEGRLYVERYIFNSGIVKTPIVKPLLGDSAGVFGAALL